MEILYQIVKYLLPRKNYYKNSIPFLHRKVINSDVRYNAIMLHVGSVTDLLRERKK